MKYTEILKKNKELGANLAGERYSICVLSNIVVNQLKDVLELNLREHNVNAEVVFGDYDNIVQDSERFSDFDAVIIFWEISNLIDGFHYKASISSDAELESLNAKVITEIGIVFKNLERVPLVIFNKFVSTPFDDPLQTSALALLCEQLNSNLSTFSKSSRVLFDINKVFLELSLQNCINERQFQMSKSLYSLDFFRTYSEFISPIFLSIRGRSKKALILDCDNTLWGGIIGEDGLENIQLGASSRQGKIFYEIQNQILSFKERGIILGICSKNNPADVDNVLDKHPESVLKLSDIVIKKVNWQNKAENIKNISLELNIGIDSIVFVDDSDFELGLIKKELPEVACVQVPTNLSEYPAVIRGLSKYFFNISSTSEDKAKTELYKQEFQRKEREGQHQTIDSYLESLKLEIHVIEDHEMSIARASQLSQKTNQFNMTTKRYTESEIEAMAGNETFSIVTFSVKDTYGDYGITGLIIINYPHSDPQSAVIDSFMMSCRIIGRNIEFVIFDHIVRMIKSKHKSSIIAEYRPTLKNGQVKNFYGNLGFDLVESTDDIFKYNLNLTDYQAKEINYIQIN